MDIFGIAVTIDEDGGTISCIVYCILYSCVIPRSRAPNIEYISLYLRFYVGGVDSRYTTHKYKHETQEHRKIRVMQMDVLPYD